MYIKQPVLHFRRSPPPREGPTVFLQSSSPLQRRNGAHGTSERCKGSWKEALQGQTIDPPRRAPPPPPMFGTGAHNFRGNLLFSLALPLPPLSFTPFFFYPLKCQQTFFFFFLQIISKTPASSTVEIGVMTRYEPVACICSRLA